MGVQDDFLSREPSGVEQRQPRPFRLVGFFCQRVAAWDCQHHLLAVDPLIVEGGLGLADGDVGDIDRAVSQVLLHLLDPFLMDDKGDIGVLRVKDRVGLGELVRTTFRSIGDMDLAPLAIGDVTDDVVGFLL